MRKSIATSITDTVGYFKPVVWQTPPDFMFEMYPEVSYIPEITA
jgi:hypothetical protein